MTEQGERAAVVARQCDDLVAAALAAHRAYKDEDYQPWGGRASLLPQLQERARQLAGHLRRYPETIARARAAMPARAFAEVLAHVHGDVGARNRLEVYGEYRLPDGTSCTRAGHTDLAYCDLIVAILTAPEPAAAR
jgi:hypothetical protein